MIPVLLPLLLASMLPTAEAARRRAPPPPAPAPAAPAGPSAEETALVDAVLARNAPSVDYLFLIETAADGMDAANAARAEIAEIVQSARDGDTVTIAAVHTRPIVALETVRLDGLNRVQTVEQVKNLQLTAGRDFDLGAALNYAALQMSRKGAAPVQLVFFVSTFCHRPPVLSDWDGGGTTCHQVKGQDRILASLGQSQEERLVQAWYLRRPYEMPQGDAGGLDVAKKLFGEGELISLADNPWSTWARGWITHAGLNRVLPLVKRDVANARLNVTVKRAPTVANPVAQLEISASTRWLDVRLEQLTIQGGKGTLPTELSLTPTATLDVPVAVAATPFAVLPHEDTVTLPFSVSAQGTLQPPAALTAVGQNAALGALSATVETSYPRTYGLPWWAVTFFGVGLFGTGSAAAVFLRRRLRRVRLGGAFSYRRQGGPRIPLDIAERDEVYLTITADGALAPGRRTEAVLALRMVKQGVNAFPETEILVDGVEINKKLARRGKHRIVAGATSFQFGEYRLAWE